MRKSKEDKYHIHQDGVAITAKPLSLSEVQEQHGGVKKLESSGFKLVKDTMKKADMIPGGLADKKTSKDFDSKSLKSGIKVEMEHTSDKNIAKEIAMDHLTEDADYYNKLKTIEKKEGTVIGKIKPKRIRVDREADGKQELDYGTEELDKEGEGFSEQPMEEAQAQNSAQVAQQEYDKKLKDKWINLKKAMADDAFLSMEEELAPEEEGEEQPQDPEMNPEQQDQEGQEPSEEEMQQMMQQGQDQPPSDNQSEQEGGEEEMDPEHMDHLAQMLGGEEAPEEMMQEGQDQSVPEMESEQPSEGEDRDVSQESEEEIMQHVEEGDATPEEEEAAEDILKQMGYSEPEIAHIVHGHHFPDVDVLKQEKANTEKSSREGELSLKQLEMEIKQMEAALKDGHGKKLNSLEADHKNRTLDLEHEHAKRMKELEYEKAKRDSSADDDTEHKARLRDVEYQRAQKDIPGDRFDDTQHQQRMMDLEYERAQREMELDLEIKKKQSELKMKQMQVDAVQRGKDKVESAKQKAVDKKSEIGSKPKSDAKVK